MRKSIIYIENNSKRVNSFSYELYRIYMEKNNLKAIELKDIPLDHLNQTYIDFVGPPKTIEHISYYDVLNETIPPDYFYNKIVLIGPYGVGIVDDYYYTSIDNQSQMYGVEMHANIVQNLLRENFKREYLLANMISILILILILYKLYEILTPVKSFLLSIIFGVSYIAFAKTIYNKGIILQIFYPLLTIITMFVASILFKYIKEYFERIRINNIFGKYVHPQVVERILNDKEGLNLGGIKKKVTILFVDIRGFTTLSEQLSPEVIVEMLNEYLDLTAKCIFKHNGTLDKFIGDSAMAIYNAPLDLEHHELAAIKTGIEIQESIRLLNENLKQKFNRTIDLGVGINTGHAIVGNIGSELRMEYTAIGDVVNTASRIEGTSKSGQVLISEDTYEKTKQYIKAELLGEIKVKGKEKLIKIYNVKEMKGNV